MSKLLSIDLVKPEVESRKTLPAVLTIAGSDSSGGAGIEADLKTFTSHGVYGLTCITCLTAQNTQLVKEIENTPISLLRNILELNFKDFLEGYDENPLSVIKTGMLTKEAVTVLIDYISYLKEKNVKLIMDPVMVSTSGSKLFDDEGMKLCVEKLIHNCFLVTPNFQEAIALQKISSKNSGEIEINTLENYTNFAVKLQKLLGCENILIKGGHIPWDLKTDSPFKGDKFENNENELLVIDVLYESKTDNITIFKSLFINTKNTHGTGCTLSSSIAANLAKGYSLSEALPLSINYVHKAMLSLERKLGHGNGPLNHMILLEEMVLNTIKLQEEKNFSIEIINNHESFLKFFIMHDKIKDNWKNYIQHEFVKLLARNQLPFDQFLYFLKQDYYYLINYAQIHALAASVAKSYHQIHTEAIIIEDIIEEIERHKTKLCKKYNIDYERDKDLDIELNPGKACLNYCNYLLEISKKEDFLGIKVALAPCLHGYRDASLFGIDIRKSIGDDLGILNNREDSEVYSSWLNDYSSHWYDKAYKDGEESLQYLLANSVLSPNRVEELVEIFNKVTILEIEFWNEVLKI